MRSAVELTTLLTVATVAALALNGALRLPHRYLTLMMSAWAIGGMPLSFVGFVGAF